MAGEEDGLLDGDVLPQHDDPLDEQADEPMAPGEVERLQAVDEPVNLPLQVSAGPFQPRSLLVRSLRVLTALLPGFHLKHLRLLEPIT